MHWNCNISIYLRAYKCSSVDVFIWYVKGTLCDIKFIFKTWILTYVICARIFTFSPLLIVYVCYNCPVLYVAVLFCWFVVYFMSAVFCVIWIAPRLRSYWILRGSLWLDVVDVGLWYWATTPMGSHGIVKRTKSEHVRYLRRLDSCIMVYDKEWGGGVL